MSLSEFIKNCIQWILKHKYKFFLTFIATLLFITILFPYDDLSDYVTQKVAQSTQNQIFLRFESLGISAFPPSLAMKKVEIDTPYFTTVKSSVVTLAPSVRQLLAFRLGASFSASDLFKGKISGSASTLQEKDKQKILFNVDYNNLDILALSEFLESIWPIRGTLSLGLKGSVELLFNDQPDVEIEIAGQQIVLPNTLPAQIPFIGGTLIPQIQWSLLTLKGRLVNRELIIDNAILGNDKDNLRTLIKGKVQVTFVRMGPDVVPQWGPYDLRIDLQMNRSFDEEFKKRLAFVYDQIAKFRVATAQGSRFMLRVNASSFQTMANMTPITSM